jgi:hypothetical protein
MVAQVIERETRIGEILDAAAAFFSEYLWTTEIGGAIRARIAREGVEEETIRAFGVGYVPGEHGFLPDHLAGRGYSDRELYEAGIATRSRRGRVHSQFRSRIMFPIRDRDGRMLGFAGMATNPGPSWPLWLISPDRGRFDKRTAIFAFDRAAAAIGEAGRAVVFRDCLEVLRAHRASRCEAVAVIRCSITSEHVAQISTALGASPTAVALERREDSAGVVISPAPDREHDRDGLPLGSEIGSKERARSSETELRPDPVETRTPAQRVLLQVARVAFGLGIPLTWLAIMQPDLDITGGADPAFIGAIAGVAGTYVVLAIVSSIAAARVRGRSRARRMRGAWEMGATEWQPLAWTYHMLEDILVAAAIISAAVSMFLFAAIGGFTN